MLMATSSRPAPSAAAIDDAASQVVAAAAGDVAGQSQLDVRQLNDQAHDAQRQPQSLLHALHLTGAADKVCEYQLPHFRRASDHALSLLGASPGRE